jgi:L-lactate permease
MDFLVAELHKIENILIIACVAFAVAYVLYVFFVKKSFIALVAALLTAGIFVWGVNNIGWFRKEVGKETGQNKTRDFGGVPRTPIMNPPGMVVILTRGKDR